MIIKDNVLRVLSQIEEIAKRCGRDKQDVMLVCASKYADVIKIREAFEAGVRIFGENKVQDAVQKSQQLNELAIEWHMIGHLQTNKAREAVGLFSLIHSVDSAHLAQEINKQAEKINKVQDILIEVNTTSEPQKYGVDLRGAPKLAQEITIFKNIRLRGLMTMGKFTDTPETNRVYFKKLRELKEEINGMLRNIGYPLLTVLSMGMTDDFKVAIEEGSTMVRIGRAIFTPT